MKPFALYAAIFMMAVAPATCLQQPALTCLGSPGCVSGAVASVTGTANEVTCSPTTGAVICSLPTGLTFTGKTVTNGTLTTPIMSGYTVAGLPAATTAGQVVVVTDASTAGSCTVGGGSAIAFCRASGAAWVPLGDGGGGGAGDVTDVGDCSTGACFKSGGTGGLLFFAQTAAPGSPAAGNQNVWVDSTDARLHDKNPAGTIGTTVVADTGAANNFLTAISAAGAISRAQPAFSNLSGALGSTQLTGTSGGVPYFSAANTYGSSAVLTSGQFVVGGGAGAAPATSFSVVPIANGGSGTASTLTGLVRGSASAFTAAELSGDATTSGSNAVTLAASFKIRLCEIHIGDSGAASPVLADDNDGLRSCKNVYGLTLTVTAVTCWANTGSPTVTPIITGGSATSILSGACTCDQTAGGAACSLNGSPTQTSNQLIDGNITTAGGAAKEIVMYITRTQ